MRSQRKRPTELSLPAADKPLRCLLGIALSGDETALGLRQVDSSGRVQTDVQVDHQGTRDAHELVRAIDRLLQSSRISVAELSGIAFSAGPGGFTRVRVACAVAQGLALGIRVPVAALDSLAIRARAARAIRPDPAADTDVVVLTDARMAQVYAAHFPADNDLSLAGEGAELVPLGQIGQWLATRLASLVCVDSLIFTGDALDRLQTQLRDFACPPDGSRLVQPDSAQEIRALLELAVRASWQHAADVAPRYVRDKVALNVAEQSALRAGRARLAGPG